MNEKAELFFEIIPFYPHLCARLYYLVSWCVAWNSLEVVGQVWGVYPLARCIGGVDCSQPSCKWLPPDQLQGAVNRNQFVKWWILLLWFQIRKWVSTTALNILPLSRCAKPLLNNIEKLPPVALSLLCPCSLQRPKIGYGARTWTMWRSYLPVPNTRYCWKHLTLFDTISNNAPAVEKRVENDHPWK